MNIEQIRKSIWLASAFCCVLMASCFENQQPENQGTSAQHAQDRVEERQLTQGPSTSEADVWKNRAGETWPQFLGEHTDSSSTETGILKDWSNGKLRVRWLANVGEGYGIGSISDGKYLHFDRIDDFARLVCRNVSTGEVMWEYKYETSYRDLYGYDGGPRTSPVIDGKRVYVYGVEGEIHCINIDSGNQIWHVDTKKEFGVVQNFFGVGSTPLVYKEHLIAVVGGSPRSSQEVAPGALDLVKPNGTGIVAFNKLTGAVLYKSINDLASYSSPLIGKFGNQTTGIVWLRGSLFAFNPENGDVLWEFPWRARKLESVNVGCPVIIDDYVFISECYGLGSALLKNNQSNFDIVWKDDKGRNKKLLAHFNTPVVADELMFASSGKHSNGATLRCINWKTGELKWEKDGFARSSILMVDGHLIVLGEYGKLALVKITASGYQQVTEFIPSECLFIDGSKCDLGTLRHPCWAAPILSHGMMMVRDKNRVICFDLIPLAD